MNATTKITNTADRLLERVSVLVHQVVAGDAARRSLQAREAIKLTNEAKRVVRALDKVGAEGVAESLARYVESFLPRYWVGFMPYSARLKFTKAERQLMGLA